MLHAAFRLSSAPRPHRIVSKGPKSPERRDARARVSIPVLRGKLAHSERASIIATLGTGSREARNGTEMQSSRREKYSGTVEHTRSLIFAASGLFQPGHPAVTASPYRTSTAHFGGYDAFC
jgi:hypothetical protein